MYFNTTTPKPSQGIFVLTPLRNCQELKSFHRDNNTPQEYGARDIKCTSQEHHRQMMPSSQCPQKKNKYGSSEHAFAHFRLIIFTKHIIYHHLHKPLE